MLLSSSWVSSSLISLFFSVFMMFPICKAWKEWGSLEGFSSSRRFPFLDCCIQTQHKSFCSSSKQNNFFSAPHSFHVRTIVFLSFLNFYLFIFFVTKSKHIGKLLWDCTWKPSWIEKTNEICILFYSWFCCFVSYGDFGAGCFCLVFFLSFFESLMRQ